MHDGDPLRLRVHSSYPLPACLPLCCFLYHTAKDFFVCLPGFLYITLNSETLLTSYCYSCGSLSRLTPFMVRVTELGYYTELYKY